MSNQSTQRNQHPRVTESGSEPPKGDYGGKRLRLRDKGLRPRSGSRSAT